MTGSPKPAGAAGAGGAVTAQPVTAWLWWARMLQQPIVAQLPGGLSTDSQSQPGPLLCDDHAEQPTRAQVSRDTQCLGGCGWAEALRDLLSPSGIQRTPSLWGIRCSPGPSEPQYHEGTPELRGTQ